MEDVAQALWDTGLWKASVVCPQGWWDSEGGEAGPGGRCRVGAGVPTTAGGRCTGRGPEGMVATQDPPQQVFLYRSENLSPERPLPHTECCPDTVTRRTLWATCHSQATCSSFLLGCDGGWRQVPSRAQPWPSAALSAASPAPWKWFSAKGLLLCEQDVLGAGGSQGAFTCI